MQQNIDYSKGIYDARQLGTGRMLILGIQHMFAMFGATVLVPLLTGLSVSTTLLCAGLGTLLFHFITGNKVLLRVGPGQNYAPLSYYGERVHLNKGDILKCVGVSGDWWRVAYGNGYYYVSRKYARRY